MHDGVFAQQRDDCGRAELRELLDDVIHLLAFRDALSYRNGDLRRRSRSEDLFQMRRYASFGNMDRRPKIRRRRIEDLDRVSALHSQHVPDFMHVASAECDGVTAPVRTLDKETRPLRHYSGLNASLTLSKNERSSMRSPPAWAYSSSSSRWRRLTFAGTTT